MVKNMNYKKLLFITTFTLFSIAINYCCSYLAGLIAFPLYLDSIMTIAVTALCGLVPGVICAFCSNFLVDDPPKIAGRYTKREFARGFSINSCH